MPDQRLRRLASISTTLRQRIMFTGSTKQIMAEEFWYKSVCTTSLFAVSLQCDVIHVYLR